MPDHVHVLVEGRDASSDLQAFAHLAKQLTGYVYKQRTRRKLWQEGFWDRVLRDEDSTWDVVRYVCENPLRKQLVERWDAYEFVGSGIMTKQQLAEELQCRPGSRWRP
jgi:putative transposase